MQQLAVQRRAADRARAAETQVRALKRGQWQLGARWAQTALTGTCEPLWVRMGTLRWRVLVMQREVEVATSNVAAARESLHGQVLAAEVA